MINPSLQRASQAVTRSVTATNRATPRFPTVGCAVGRLLRCARNDDEARAPAKLATATTPVVLVIARSATTERSPTAERTDGRLLRCARNNGEARLPAKLAAARTPAIPAIARSATTKQSPTAGCTGGKPLRCALDDSFNGMIRISISKTTPADYSSTTSYCSWV